MVYAVEIFAPSGNQTSTSSAHLGVLTPNNTLTQCLAAQQPLIFHLELGPAYPAERAENEPGVGLILPVLDAQGLRACVTLVWRVATFAGALELWRPDASGVLRLSDAYYGSGAAGFAAANSREDNAQMDSSQMDSAKSTRVGPFEQVSRQTAFGVLEGLPGVTFDAHEPVLFETLSHARGFVRAQAAAVAGLSVGLGLPVFKHQTAHCAVLLLSSGRYPLARAFEVWNVVGRTPQLDSSLNLDAEKQLSNAKPEAELTAKVVKSRLPQLICRGAALEVALPIFKGTAVGSVVVLKN